MSSVPVYVEGRGNLGRTPMFSQTDFYVYHEFRMGNDGKYRLRFDANASNVFNQSTPYNYYRNYLNRNDGSWLQFENETDVFQPYNWKQMVTDQELRTDPGYNQPRFFQAIRDLRFGVKFSF